MGSSQAILDAEAIARALRRMAHEILEQNPEPARFALVGIPLRGTALAKRLARIIEEIDGRAPETGSIDVSMHRDDLRLRARLTSVQETKLPLPLESLTVILVDDVVFTGRTCRAAMDALSSFGRPARIQLAALLDRGHRELPIRPDYVGRAVQTERAERVSVRLENVDEEADSVRIERL